MEKLWNILIFLPFQGVFIFETFSSTYEKIFYGLKKNGRYYFNNSENKPFYYLNTKSNKEIYGYISNSMFIKNGEEYLLNMIRGEYDYHYTEIYDFNHGKVFYKLTKQI